VRHGDRRSRNEHGLEIARCHPQIQVLVIAGLSSHQGIDRPPAADAGVYTLVAQRGQQLGCGVGRHGVLTHVRIDDIEFTTTAA
jgi:hypothetical protein